MAKKNKNTDDFFERKYRIYSDFLNNFDESTSFKGLDYKDYFIKHFEYEFIYSLKLFCLVETYGFNIGAKASFIRRAIESYVYISLAKKNLIYIENYKLFKFKLKKDPNLIGKKEKDQIMKKFYLKNINFESFLNSTDFIYMYGIGDKNTPFSHLEYYFNNVDDPYFNKEEMMKLYNDLGVIVHHNLSSSYEFKELYKKEYANIVNKFVKPILINKIAKEYEESLSKVLVTPKINFKGFIDLTYDDFKDLGSLICLRNKISSAIEDDDKTIYTSFMQMIFEYLTGFIFLYYFKEFFSYECYFKSFLEKCSIFYSLIKLKEDNKIEYKELKILIDYYEYLNITKINNFKKYNEDEEDKILDLVLSYSPRIKNKAILKSMIINNPKIVLGVSENHYSNMVNNFLKKFIDDKEFVDDIFLTYKESLSASHANGDFYELEEENNISKVRDIVFIACRILDEIGKNTKLEDYVLKETFTDKDKYLEELEHYNNASRGYKRFADNKGFKKTLVEKSEKVDESKREAIETYNKTIEKTISNFLTSIDNLITKINKINDYKG